MSTDPHRAPSGHASHHTSHASGHTGAAPDAVAMAELLELDAAVLHTYTAELTGWLAGLTDRAPTRILDIGSGPGTGSFALARRFPGATVTAVDNSPQMLHRLTRRAAAEGLSDRVGTVRADLDREWPRTGPYDLIWAAAFLHHLSDPGDGLARAFAGLRPGGLLAVTEMDFFPRFLPDDAGAGRPGLEARLHTATNTRPPADWGGHLTAAGFRPVATRPFAIALTAPLPPETNRYAQVCLRTLRTHAGTLLPADDLAALDTVIGSGGPLGVLRRQDLTVRTTRTTWVARKP
ncbi:class I SAM-dependent methyltransferase [Streptomyces sp. NBC_01089]|uniref:class I SAM-dependent methyltransferase n=1 Tax=Streptomyces sp. NBC_01089 TaxID=2903747 RepID=UPI00386896E3|nr:class I SAM-dependent methyltransferase [Streptomyces sp. NBC_01089]